MNVTCIHCGAQRERGPDVYWNVDYRFYLCNPHCWRMVYLEREDLGRRWMER